MNNKITFSNNIKVKKDNLKQEYMNNNIKFNAFGYTRDVGKNRWIEVNSSNKIVDGISEPVFLSSGLVDRIGEELITLDWSLGEDTVLEDGIIKVQGSDKATKQVVDLVPGKSYKFSVKISNYKSSSFYLKIDDKYVVKSKTKNGVYEGIFVFSGATKEVLLTMGNVNSYWNIDYFSIKEIRQVNFFNAPFDNSNDEIMLYNNGIKTNKEFYPGDIIHIGGGTNLISNSSFDNNIDGWTASNDDSEQSWDNQGIRLKPSNYRGSYIQVSGVSAGVSYKLTLTISNIVQGSGRIYVGRESRDNYISNKASLGLGTHSYIVTPTVSELRITLATTGKDTDDVTFDNITLEPIEQTYRAVKKSPESTKITSTYFEKIDFISRQDPILLGEDGKYRSFRGFKDFNAGFLVDDIADSYNFVKTGKNLFKTTNLKCINEENEEENYSGELIVVGLHQRLNAGSYHPAFNPFGSGYIWTEDLTTSDFRKWNESEWIDGTINAFKYAPLNRPNGGRLGGKSQRPDYKHYDKVYKNSDGGLIFRNPLAIKPNIKDLLGIKTNLILGNNDVNEENSEVTLVVGDVFMYLGGSAFKNRYSYLTDLTIYVSSGLDDYTLTQNGNLLYGKEGEIVSIKANDRETKLIYKDDYKLERLDKYNAIPFLYYDKIQYKTPVTLTKQHKQLLTQGEI